MARDRVPAVGGERSVPAPDAAATDYLLLGLRLDQRTPGLIDAYFGPAELKARAELEPLPSASRLADEAAALRERIGATVASGEEATPARGTTLADDERAAWLDCQVRALELRARAAAGEPLTYRARLRAALDAEPEPTPSETWAQMRGELERLVPGRGPLARRLSDWDARWAVPPELLPAVVETAIPWLREAAAAAVAPFRLPDGEAVQSHVVTGARSAGYAEFLGGLRTRIDISADLPRQLPEVVDTLAHETYTGHHLDFAAREARRVEELGQLEATLLLADTPEAYLAEGLAIVGTRLLLPPETLAAAYRRLAEAAGLAHLDAEADLAARIQVVRERGMAAGADAALRINEDGRAPEEVVEWLIDEVLLDPARARARVANAVGLDAALFGYAGGSRLVEAWCGLEGPDRTVPRFVGLLGATTTPSLLEADLAADRGAQRAARQAKTAMAASSKGP